jgi:hypothetical protein
MLKTIQSRIQTKLTGKPVGADEADLDRLRLARFRFSGVRI